MRTRKVVDIQVLNVEERISNIFILYAQILSDGKKRICRSNVKRLGGYYECFTTKQIVSAVCIGKVYCGALRNDARLLFIIKLTDGSVQLIQSREKSVASLKLFELT